VQKINKLHNLKDPRFKLLSNLPTSTIMSFTCERCGHRASLKGNLVAHLKRKHPCKTNLRDVSPGELLRELSPRDTYPFACGHCAKKFKHACSLSRHKSVCEQKNKDESKHRETQSSSSPDDRGNPTNVVNIMNINNVNNNVTHNNIVINAFGREDLRSVTPTQLSAYVRRTSKGLVDLLEQIHFQDPSNRNVRAFDHRGDLVEYHDGNRWLFAQKHKIIQRLVENGQGLLQDHFEEREDDLRKNMSYSLFTHIQKWFEQMDAKQQDVYGDVVIEVFVLLLNKAKAKEQSSR